MNIADLKNQAAVFDHPAAVETVVRETGAPELRAVIHCQGSTSFMMSALAGLVPKVKTIVSNAVSLHTIVPRWSHLKLDYAIAPVGRLTRFLNPQWGLEAPTLTAKAINAVVQLTHHECRNPVCKEVSFTYGSGFPPIAEIVDGLSVAESLFDGYGEGAPSGLGPRQDLIADQGNAYLRRYFPQLDLVIRATIAQEWR